jgi:hypothetical protein
MAASSAIVSNCSNRSNSAANGCTSGGGGNGIGPYPLRVEKVRPSFMDSITAIAIEKYEKENELLVDQSKANVNKTK